MKPSTRQISWAPQYWFTQGYLMKETSEIQLHAKKTKRYLEFTVKSFMVPSHHQSSRAQPTKIIRMKDQGPLTTLSIHVEKRTVTIPGFICFSPDSPQLSMFNVDLMTSLILTSY
jgi:hypothetical protein